MVAGGLSRPVRGGDHVCGARDKCRNGIGRGDTLVGPVETAHGMPCRQPDEAAAAAGSRCKVKRFGVAVLIEHHLVGKGFRVTSAGISEIELGQIRPGVV